LTITLQGLLGYQSTSENELVVLPWISPSLFEVASITTDSFAHKVRTCRFFIPTEIEGSKVQDEDNQYIIASRDVHFLTDVELVLIPPTTASMMRLPNQHSRILYLRILRCEKERACCIFHRNYSISTATAELSLMIF
jgi:hypothetical protein